MRLDVVFVMPDLGGGGAQRVMLRLAKELDYNRFKINLIVLGESRTLTWDVPLHVTVYYLGATRLRNGIIEAISLIRRLKPALVFSTMGYINLALLAAKSFLPKNTCLVVREANVVEATLSALPAWVPGRITYAILYHRADAVVVQTNRIKEQIERLAPLVRRKLVVIPNPVSTANLTRRALPPIRSSANSLVLIGAGRLSHQKGFDRLIDLMPALPHAHLTIYGDGPDRQALEARISALGLQKNVTLAGFRDDLPRAMAGADLFVLPSRWEGLPNVVLESLALGTPVVASNEAGIEDIQRAAPLGTVTIAPVGDAFVSAIKNQKRKTSPISLDKTFLPPDYAAKEVVARFTALFDRLLAQSDV